VIDSTAGAPAPARRPRAERGQAPGKGAVKETTR
jgi:hypothetical protein